MRAKRAFDVVVAALALLLLSPVLAAVALAVRMTLGSPVLFRQVRPGLGGRPFELRKFRTLRPPARPGEELTDYGPGRESRIGRFLRASGVDELPELVNVLTGEMSLVGPRPLLMQYLPLYTAEQASRHDVRPGLTGLSQVTAVQEWDGRLALDVEYVRSRTFGLDLRILALTVRAVFRRDGGSGGEVFTGSLAGSHGQG